jgi:hypothetical protein
MASAAVLALVRFALVAALLLAALLYVGMQTTFTSGKVGKKNFLSIDIPISDVGKTYNVEVDLDNYSIAAHTEQLCKRMMEDEKLFTSFDTFALNCVPTIHNFIFKALVDNHSIEPHNIKIGSYSDDVSAHIYNEQQKRAAKQKEQQRGEVSTIIEGVITIPILFEEKQFFIEIKSPQYTLFGVSERFCREMINVFGVPQNDFFPFIDKCVIPVGKHIVSELVNKLNINIDTLVEGKLSDEMSAWLKTHQQAQPVNQALTMPAPTMKDGIITVPILFENKQFFIKILSSSFTILEVSESFCREMVTTFAIQQNDIMPFIDRCVLPVGKHVVSELTNKLGVKVESLVEGRLSQEYYEWIATQINDKVDRNVSEKLQSNLAEDNKVANIPISYEGEVYTVVIEVEKAAILEVSEQFCKKMWTRFADSFEESQEFPYIDRCLLPVSTYLREEMSKLGVPHVKDGFLSREFVAYFKAAAASAKAEEL